MKRKVSFSTGPLLRDYNEFQILDMAKRVGADFMIEEAEFAVKVMKHLLKSRYGEQ